LQQILVVGTDIDPDGRTLVVGHRTADGCKDYQTAGSRRGAA
jgi:hypothetical protein